MTGKRLLTGVLKVSGNAAGMHTVSQIRKNAEALTAAVKVIISRTVIANPGE